MISKFIIVNSDQTLYEAGRRLAESAGDDKPNWYIVVRLPQGGWAVLTAIDLMKVIKENENASEILETPLNKIPDPNLLIPCKSIDIGEMDISAAKRLVFKSRRHRLVVCENGKPVGLLTQIFRDGGDTKNFDHYFGPRQHRESLPAIGIGEEVFIPPAEPRVQVDVTVPNVNGEAKKLKNAFVSGEHHILEIWIGRPDEDSISANNVFPYNELLTRCLLTVTFEEPNHSREMQLAQFLYYPDQHCSERVHFSFIACPDVESFRGRLKISHQSQILQTLLLQGKVLASASQVDVKDEITLTIESNVQQLTPTPNAATRDTYILTEMRGGDLYVELPPEGNSGCYIPKFEKAAGIISAQLEQIAGTPRNYKNLSDADSKRMLNALARHGYKFYKELAKQIGENHPIFDPATKRIQVISTHDTLIPLEILYQSNASITSTSELCEKSEEALLTGGCVCDRKEKVAKGKIICPFQFFSMSRIIEHYKISPDLSKDAARRFNPDISTQSLPLIKSAVVAVSHNVDENDVHELDSTVKNGFEQASGILGDWNAWIDAIQQYAPTLLLLIPHTETQDGFLSLEIGAENYLPVSDVDENYVRKHSNDHPVVLILGCSTALAELPFESCPAYFREGGAAIIVTTIGTVLGRHVVPVATTLINELKLAAANQQPFGEAFLRARQKALAEGLLIAVALVADGNIDWRIS